MTARTVSSNRAIFLDRDGVINVNRVDNVRVWDQFVFEDGSLDAIAHLSAAGYRLIVITNQSGIGRGHMPASVVDEIHARMIAEIERAGGHIDRVYYCPHLPDDGCACRKPSPEMLLRGRDEFQLDLTHSYLIGDWIDDIRAARAAGVSPLLVRTGRGLHALAEMEAQDIPLPPVFDCLAQAVDWILQPKAETVRV